MGTKRIGLPDVDQGAKQSRLRLLSPLRYLFIHHPEKAAYDFAMPIIFGVGSWMAYSILNPQPPLFGENGILQIVRDLLIMTVPFLVGALAAVSMGAAGNLDKRALGSEIYLDGKSLTLRQFVCYLLGYLCFISIVTLFAVVGAELLRETVIAWTDQVPNAIKVIRAFGTLVLSLLLSALTITVLWALYFLTDTVNQ